MPSLITVLGAILLSAGFSGGDMDAAVRAVVQAERDFDRAVADRGVRDGFLAFLADDGIIFRPGPVPGKPWYEARPAAQGRLTWYPIYADVSRGCNFGYTTGPWQFFLDSAVNPAAFGHYVTVWTRQGDGPWRVAIDCGISDARAGGVGREVRSPAFGKRSASLPKLPAPDASTGNSGSLMAAERAFVRRLASEPGEAARATFASDVRYLRSGSGPAVGIAAALKATAQQTAGAQEPERAVAAPAGDFGYTYGTYGEKDAAGVEQRVGYMRIWRRASDGGWKIVLDVR